MKSSFCQSCNLWKTKSDTVEYENWKSKHDVVCTRNHSGSAGKMEVKRNVRAIGRKFQMKYRRYVGDGDSKTYKVLVDGMVYGEDFIIEKKNA